MAQSLPENSVSFDWLHSDPSVVPEREADLAISGLRVLELKGRFLYLRWLRDLSEFNSDEGRILQLLAHQGDTVFIAVGPDPGHIRFSYRMPNLEDAVAFDADGLRGLIRQWLVWASTLAA
jgi:hypothetical protein